MNHPVQVYKPDWSSVLDGDPNAAAATRHKVLDLAARETIQLFTAHFTGPSTGWVAKTGGSYSWQFAEAR